MKQKLQARLLNYFLLIAFAAMLIGVEFYFEMSRADIIDKICLVNPTDHASSVNISDPLANLRIKIVIMFVVLTIVVAIVLTMFIRNITAPLQKMADVAAQINEGNLSLTVPVETQDEIAQVGNAINELTSNLQEVATMTCVTASDVLKDLESIFQDINNGQVIENEKTEEMKSALQTLVNFVDSFTLLKTDVN